jgi:4-amino-4-deoxy-L-arabinose transferase-like glycosyltransferase
VSRAAESGAPRESVWAWIALFALALTLRLAWWKFGAHVIETEGTNYARVGESLAAGRGFLGLDELGPQLIYPPLYPGLIGAGVMAGVPSEVAGRVVSVLSGALAPILFAKLGHRLYGARAGWYAGLVAALHPLLIAASVAVLSESVYLLLVLLGLNQVLGQLDRLQRWPAVVGGVFLGLAYLCRPEALFLTVAFALIVVMARRAVLRRAVEAMASLLLAFAVCAVPYVLFLHQQTGLWRFEAKTPQGMIFQLGVLAGQSNGQIYWGIDDNLEGRGLSNTSDVSQARVAPPSALVRAKLALYQAMQNFPRLLASLVHLQFGGFVLGLLVGLGLFGSRWDRPRIERELPLLALTVLVVAPFLIWPFTLDRSLFLLMVPFVLWTGQGLACLGAWADDSARALGLGAQARHRSALALPALAAVPVLATSLVGVRQTDEMSQGWSNLVDYAPIGRWLGEKQPRARIADSGPTVAFYAGAVLIRFPWTDGPTALRYLDKNKVAFVVLREDSLKSRPYLQAWFAEVPDPRLELEREFSGRSGVTRIYRLKTPEAVPAASGGTN